jgi:hypothetical protein
VAQVVVAPSPMGRGLSVYGRLSKSLSEYFASPLAHGVQFGDRSSSNCTEVRRWPMDPRQGFTRSPRPCGGGSIW